MDDDYCPSCGSNDITLDYDTEQLIVGFIYYCESCGASWGGDNEESYESD